MGCRLLGRWGFGFQGFRASGLWSRVLGLRVGEFKV